MAMRSDEPVRLTSIRPLVRYVDENQGVIDIKVDLKPRVPTRSSAQSRRRVELLVEVDGDDGFHDEQHVRVSTGDSAEAIRFELLHPQRWWPAGMGEQALYRLSVSLIVNGETADVWTGHLGLTSVRNTDPTTPLNLLVNGQDCRIGQVVAVDAVDENQFLPVAGDSLVVVRGHYGPDVLYEAADRAGILLVQCVPIAADGHPEAEMATQIDRLASHPSLAGWFVGHLGYMTERIAYCLSSLDPTHNVFRRVPGDWPA